MTGRALQWRIQGGGGSSPGAHPPLQTKIFLISCSLSENMANLYAGALILEGWRPLLRGILDPSLNWTMKYQVQYSILIRVYHVEKPRPFISPTYLIWSCYEIFFTGFRHHFKSSSHLQEIMGNAHFTLGGNLSRTLHFTFVKFSIKQEGQF